MSYLGSSNYPCRIKVVPTPNTVRIFDYLPVKLPFQKKRETTIFDWTKDRVKLRSLTPIFD